MWLCGEGCKFVCFHFFFSFSISKEIFATALVYSEETCWDDENTTQKMYLQKVFERVLALLKREYAVLLREMILVGV